MGTGALLQQLHDGSISAKEVAQECIFQVNTCERDLHAFAHFDPDLLTQAAKDADQMPSGQRGLLHGLPIGIKDVIDTTDYPTEYGCRYWKGHRPLRDAACVSAARLAGGVIAGKTVTAEYALVSPGATRNPHDLARTPGGSSSGSAAAVAAGMLPVALGTQTNGSTIRPASYCGVYGFKPTHGRIALEGVATIALSLDTMGIFSRDLEGIALVADALGGAEKASRRQGQRDLIGALKAASLRRWRVGVTRTAWGHLESYVPPMIESLALRLGRWASVHDVSLPDYFDQVYDEHMTVQQAGAGAALFEYYIDCKDAFSEILQQYIERGREIRPPDLQRALSFQRRLQKEMDYVLDDVDVLITASATGEAPLAGVTGNPVMSTMWTFSGTPALSVPIFEGPCGMPVGLQVIAHRGRDANVLGFGALLQHCVGA